MAAFHVRGKNRTVAFDDAAEFIKAVELLLRLGEQFVLTVARRATETLKALNALLAEHKIKLTVTADSDPKSMDYLVNAGIGFVVGGVVGAGAGVGGALLAQHFIQGVQNVALGPIAAVGAAIGAAVGAMTAIAVTHWGLKVQFVITDDGPCDVFEFQPAA